MSVKTVLVDIGHVVAWPLEHGAQLVKTLEDALKDEPQVKTAVTGLIAEIGVVTADGAIVVSSKGVDLVADAAALVAAKQLFSYVLNTFLPAVQAVYKDLAPDVQALETPAAPAPAPAAAVAGPVPGPGLHTVVPA
jgi:hypothetical protein